MFDVISFTFLFCFNYSPTENNERSARLAPLRTMLQYYRETLIRSTARWLVACRTHARFLIHIGNHVEFLFSMLPRPGRVADGSERGTTEGQ